VLPIAPTLFAVLFGGPVAAAAVAGGAVSIPIIIHLLNRKRFRVVEWAAMRFLLAAQRKNARRMRIEQFLLLAVRCLILLLVVLAMASVTPWAESFWRWVNPSGGLGRLAGGARTHKILVIDGSLSMGLRVGDATCFERAKAKALEIVQEGGGGDGFSVVLMASPPRRVVPEPSEDGRKVAAELRALRMTHGNADLAGTLAAVGSLLQASPGKFPAKEVYFITDMQRSGWVASRPGDLAAALQRFTQTKAKAIFVDVGQEGASNLAVVGLELGDPVATTAGETRVLATLMNYGDSKEDVSVRLLVGRAKEKAGDKPLALREVAVASVPAPRRQLTPVGFSYKFPAAGDYLVQVRAGHDKLPFDDVRSAVVRVRNTVPVMLVNGKPAPEAFDRATGWLRVALNPYDEGERIPATVTPRPRVLTQFQFADETLGDLTNYDAVFLCDVPRLSPAEVRRLEAHVRRGGAVFFCMGDRIDLGAYNELLYRDGHGLLPARLLERVAAPAGYTYQLTMDPEADRTDPLRLFQDSAARERLLMPHFEKFVKVEPARAARGVAPRRVLGFAAAPLPGKASLGKPPATQGGAAVLEWRPPLLGKDEVGRMKEEGKAPGGPDSSLILPPSSFRGRVVLITTTVNSDWNNWPASQAFPPLMQELLNYAASARLRERSLQVGEPIELYLPSAAGGAEAVVDFPAADGGTQEGEGKPEDRRTVATQPLAEGSVLRVGGTDLSGVYRVRVGQHPREHLFAVNVPASTDDQQQSESNLARTNKEELQKVYPEWDVQVVTDPRQAEHAQAAPLSTEELVYVPQGTGVARVLLLAVLVLLLSEVVLAWLFGHYSGAATLPTEQPARAPGLKEWALAFAPWVLFAALAVVLFVLGHDLWTGDFLGFLPEAFRGWVERLLDVPPPSAGEGSRWRLEYLSYFFDGKADPWLAGTLLVLAGAGVGFVYWHEGNAVSTAARALLLGLRVAILVVMLVVLLPQVRLFFERQGWPDVVILIDDSYSMSTLDAYRDEKVKAAADALAARAELSDEEKQDLARAVLARGAVSRASRLRLAQTYLTGDGPQWLENLLTRRKVRLHVYHCSTRAARLADATTADEVKQAAAAVKAVKAEKGNDSSQLGVAVRQALNDFRGSSLAAVVMFTDGVTTEGEDLAGVSKYAAQVGVPLYFVGVGDAHEVRDLYLHDLQAVDSVYVNDRLVFEVRMTAQGLPGLSVPVTLHEKGKERELDRKQVKVEAGGTVKVRLTHRPTEAGEKAYVIRVPVQEGEVDKENNRIDKPVYVREAKQIKVLYVEGYRRYEYHFVKTLLERESNRIRGNKSVNLKVLLLDADDQFASEDRTALSSFPTPFRNVDVHTKDDDLWSYDVVLLGDVDPEPRNDNKMNEHLKNLADFVRERGGGLLMMSGERYAPRAYANSPLKDVLPIDVTGERAPDGADEGIVEGYRAELTPVGVMHPIFRFSPDENDSKEVWNKFQPFFWYAEGYAPKRAAEVLAVHPTAPAAGGKAGKHPLVVQQFSGAGRCMFFGFDETWRWNWREDQTHFNDFWVQAVRYLARSKVGRTELRLDRQTPYRRGEPIRMTVRFPDDERPPADNTEVKVVVERRAAGQAGDKETRTVQLTRLEGSRGTFEATLTQTPEGDYRFWMSEPAAKPKPQAACKVLAPPGEMERLRMNRAEMEAAAAASGGKFYTLADAERLPDELPSGNRVTVNTPGPPWLLWNGPLVFLLVLGLFTTEWLLRKQKNLL
jgi:uncharacterized membrane protein